jgi:hypothetical protein
MILFITAGNEKAKSNVTQRISVMVRGRWLSEGKLQQILNASAK